MLHKLAKFHYQTSYSVQYVSCFMVRYLMKSWHLNIWKVKIWLSQEQKELLDWNKKQFFLFQKCSLLEITSKINIIAKQNSKNVTFTTFKNEWLEKNMFKENYEKLCQPITAQCCLFIHHQKHKTSEYNWFSDGIKMQRWEVTN